MQLEKSIQLTLSKVLSIEAIELFFMMIRLNLKGGESTMDDLYTLLETAKSNRDYRNILEQLRWPSGFQCPHCAEGHGYKIESRDLYECSSCGIQTSATAGTFLHGVKNLKTWVEAILSFINERGTSTVAAAELFNLDYTSTWFMMQKIRLVLGGLIEESEETVLIPCSILKTVLYKASTGDMHGNCLDDSVELEPAGMDSAGRLAAYILSTFLGVSRKYSQLYAYEYALRKAVSSESRMIEPLSVLSKFVRPGSLYREGMRKYCAPPVILV